VVGIHASKVGVDNVDASESDIATSRDLDGTCQLIIDTPRSMLLNYCKVLVVTMVANSLCH